ncbi:hypothetical protein SynBIOSE41_03104 [Synechococcus sp. BIOS-E4-1]|nr:hypothetical protein SynBIOSE41_03104 [Synechococcus sp. BIOS-E4-1]
MFLIFFQSSIRSLRSSRRFLSVFVGFVIQEGVGYGSSLALFP